MNESLMLIVEKIVRPIRAPLLKKMRMRNELYGHLTLIYEEELARQCNEQSAFETTKRRFGEPDEVRAALQATVPRWRQRVASFDQFFIRKPGETALRHAGRSAAYAMLFVAAEYLLIMLPLGQILIHKQEQFIMMAPFFGCLTACCGLLAFAAVICGDPLITHPAETISYPTLIRNAVLFGGISAFAEFSLFASIPTTFGMGNMSTMMPIGAFFAGLGLFLVVILAMRHELGQATPWTELTLTD